MEQFVIQKAVKAAKKARIALDGPAGSGKTYTALELAVGLAGGERIGLIDTEKSSADLYADRFDFDTIKLATFSPMMYIGALEAFAQAGHAVVIVDSWSHAWEGEGGALEMVDAAAKRHQGNSYVAWRDVTPLHNKMVAAILDYPGHVIVTMRTKMEYALEKDEKTGKTTPKKIGMAPIQRAGVEYEFDVVVDLDLEHNFTVSKTRLPVLDGKSIRFADRKVGRVILDDLTNGAAPATPPQIVKAETLAANGGSSRRLEQPEDTVAAAQFNPDGTPANAEADLFARQAATKPMFPEADAVVDMASFAKCMTALGITQPEVVDKAKRAAGLEQFPLDTLDAEALRHIYAVSLEKTLQKRGAA